MRTRLAVALLLLAALPGAAGEKQKLTVTALAYYVRYTIFDCYASGNDYGAFANFSKNCTTSSPPPPSGPFIIHNLVETATHRYHIVCTANVPWSKCSWLNPGDPFEAETDERHLWITAHTPDGKKKAKIKYDMLQRSTK